MKNIFSKHALEQMKLRGISKKIVEEILLHPEQIISESGKKIYQSVISFEKDGNYLIRIFVNVKKKPPVIITVYKTSKISKYHESKIR